MTASPSSPDWAYPPWPASLPPAPGDLRVVQAFVNTRDLEEGTDELESPAGFAIWLRAWNLLSSGESASAEDLAQAREVREALRCLLLANNGAPLDPSAVETLNRATGEASLQVTFGSDGLAELNPAAAGWQGSLARLLELVVVARLEGLWPRLKACPNDTCQWAFYDFSKNRSSKWCTMKRCGNLMNARAYRRRRQSTRDR